MNPEDLVVDYLRKLDVAARGLPAARRAELGAEVREHIEAALADAGSRDELAVRNVLERLGPPEEIASEAAPPSDAPASPVDATMTPATGRTGWGAVEVAGLVAFVLAWVALALEAQLTFWTSVILWLVLGALGTALIALSDRWPRRRKQITIGIFAGLYALAALVLVATLPVGTSGQAPQPSVTVTRGAAP